jgi:predicted Zn-dependent peptidase
VLLVSFVCLTSIAAFADSPFAGLEKGVVVRRLNNGLRVVLYRRGTAPVFSSVISVKVGGSDEKPGHTGIAHMLEHIAFKGTDLIGTTNPKKEKELLTALESLMLKKNEGVELTEEENVKLSQINAELEKLWKIGDFTNSYQVRGARDLNATTDKDFTNYYVSLPRSEFQYWCWLESQRIMHTVSRQFYQEREVVKEERRMRFEDSPDNKLYENVIATAFDKHPYGYPVIGTWEDLNKLSASAVDQFHAKYYIPSNIVVSVVGDVDPERDIGVLERYFGQIPAGPEPERPIEIQPDQEKERRVKIVAKAAPSLHVAYRRPNYPHPDDPAITLLDHIFAGSSVSRLHERLVKQTKVASAIGSSEAPGIAYPNLWYFFVQTREPNKNEEALRIFDSEVSRLFTNPPTDQELATAKRAIMRAQIGLLGSSRSLAKVLAETVLQHGTWKVLLRWQEQMEAVTREDLLRVAKLYLRSQSRTVGELERGGK